MLQIKITLRFLLFFIAVFLVQGTSWLHANSIETMNAEKLEALLEEHKGKAIVVNFFASWCPPCTDEIPTLAKLTKELPKDKFIVIAIAVGDTEREVQKLAKRLNMNYLYYMGTDSLAERLGITSIPANFFFNSKGDFSHSEVGFEGEKSLRGTIKALMAD